MKTKKAKLIFCITGIIIIAILLAIRFGLFAKLMPEKTPQQATPQTAPTQTAPAPSPAVQQPTPVPVQINLPQNKTAEVLRQELALGDPFVYSSGKEGEYTPLTNSKPVGLISVKGIIEVEGKPPIAILHLKDTERTYYVSKNDVIRISTKASNSDAPLEVYIVVKNIAKEEVELVQQERPDKVIIIR